METATIEKSLVFGDKKVRMLYYGTGYGYTIQIVDRDARWVYEPRSTVWVERSTGDEREAREIFIEMCVSLIREYLLG